jgi:hypothetical protein
MLKLYHMATRTPDELRDASAQAADCVAATRRSVFEAMLEKYGINTEFLARKLKAELNANETRYKYIVRDDKIKVVAEKTRIAWDIRQKARMDAHKLLGHYPAEKHEHTGEISLKGLYEEIKGKSDPLVKP